MARDEGRTAPCLGSLAATRQAPAYLVPPATAAEVADVLRIAGKAGIPVTARGSGTGMSGGCVPRPGGITVSFERMDRRSGLPR